MVYVIMHPLYLLPRPYTMRVLQLKKKTQIKTTRSDYTASIMPNLAILYFFNKQTNQKTSSNIEHATLYNLPWSVFVDNQNH